MEARAVQNVQMILFHIHNIFSDKINIIMKVWNCEPAL